MSKFNPVFSVSVFAILATVGASGYLLNNAHKVNNLIKQEDKVLEPLPQPKVESFTPHVIDVAPQVIEVPKPKVPVVKPTTSKAKVAPAALAQAISPCELVCEDNWQESNYGGRFKKCECKK